MELGSESEAKNKNRKRPKVGCVKAGVLAPVCREQPDRWSPAPQVFVSER